jgi:hypothetical protein
VINIIRALLSLLGVFQKVRAHTRFQGTVNVVSYWRRT